MLPKASMRFKTTPVSWSTIWHKSNLPDLSNFAVCLARVQCSCVDSLLRLNDVDTVVMTRPMVATPPPSPAPPGRNISSTVTISLPPYDLTIEHPPNCHKKHIRKQKTSLDGAKKSDLEVVGADCWSLSFVILKLKQFQVLKVCLVLLFYDSLEKCKIEIWINKTNTKIFLTWSQRYSHTKNEWMQ